MSYSKEVKGFTKDESGLGVVYVTKNGEVCYSYDDKEFIIYDETYLSIVGRTPYQLVALSILESYCSNYLLG